MIQLVRRYTHWLHTRWPAGTVEKLPVSDTNGLTTVAGVRIVGDLTGIPLLKFSSHTGARAVRAILQEQDFQSGNLSDPQVLDLAIIVGCVSGISSDIEAKQLGRNFRAFEATQAFSTMSIFP